MRNLTGGDYDDECTEDPKPAGPVSQGSSAVHVSPHSPEHNDEGNSEMEHPFKNEVEIKGFPVPYPVHGGHYGGAGYGCGDGFGGNGIGGLLVGALLGRGFGFGGGRGGGCGDGGARVLDTAILQQLGNVQAAVPLTALQTQAQVAESTGSINNTTLQQTLMLGGEIARASLAGQQGFANVKDSVQNSFAVLNSNIAGVNAAVNVGTLTTAIAIRDDGDKTRALISSIDRDNLNRQLAVAENTITELRLNQCRRDDNHGLEIQMINNQNQNQLQFQQQAQGFAFLQHGLAECNQLARATNAQINIGSGTLTGAAQTANPINTKL
ncbi:hypothetical protein [Klebsiella aerogenes]|uniref:hypothetical protein n=1 Tax=Klebsiella aerogenes TaxID=548 RepID=UPI0034D1A81C